MFRQCGPFAAKEIFALDASGWAYIPMLNNRQIADVQLVWGRDSRGVSRRSSISLMNFDLHQPPHSGTSNASWRHIWKDVTNFVELGSKEVVGSSTTAGH